MKPRRVSTDPLVAFTLVYSEQRWSVFEEGFSTALFFRTVIFPWGRISAARITVGSVWAVSYLNMKDGKMEEEEGAEEERNPPPEPSRSLTQTRRVQLSPLTDPHPEMMVDKQREQTVTPRSIDLAPSPLPALANNATLIPPTLNLYESPSAPPPSPPRLTKVINDQPLPPSATTSLRPALALLLESPDLKRTGGLGVLSKMKKTLR
ncbi:unnamed protein product, partial [Pleuronectes platessa]